MTSFVFRAVAGVVNTAACAVNHLVQVISPVDIGHIWEDVPAGASGGPAPTDPPSGGVADPAAETVTPDLSAAGSPLSFGDCFDCCVGHPEPPLTWEGWAVPAILDVLAEHTYFSQVEACACAPYRCDRYGWAEHVAPLIAARIGCDPARAVLALTSLQTQ